MRRSNRVSSFLKTTIDFPIVVSQKIKKHWHIAIWATTSFIIGFFLCRLVWPSYITVEKEITTLPKKPSLHDFYVEVDKSAQVKLISFLQESWIGILEIKDNEAQTVLHKRAAIGSKHGFIDLKNGVPYTVHNYFTHINTGYGIIDDGQRNFFLLVWYSGKTKAPTINPGTIYILSGKKIGIGNP